MSWDGCIFSTCSPLRRVLDKTATSEGDLPHDRIAAGGSTGHGADAAIGVNKEGQREFCGLSSGGSGLVARFWMAVLAKAAHPEPQGGVLRGLQWVRGSHRGDPEL